jgi:hypothetical protein
MSMRSQEASLSRTTSAAFFRCPPVSGEAPADAVPIAPPAASGAADAAGAGEAADKGTGEASAVASPEAPRCNCR